MAATSNRTIAILQLFSEERPILTAEDIAHAIGTSVSTAYRYIKELCAVGFLDSVSRGEFALGPAFIQYDFLMRRSDALIQHAAPLMKRLIEEIDPRSDVVLSRLFNNCVLCIHQQNGPKPHTPTRYVRGVAMPLFVGATSKVILAHLPDRSLKRLYLDNEDDIRKRFPDQTWKEFKQDLRAIRKEGYSFTVSEVSEGQAGLAAPVFRDNTVIASVSIVMAKTIFDEIGTRISVEDAVKSCARAIETIG